MKAKRRWWPKRETVLERFLDKCEFDPRTGCVLWIGGTSAGRIDPAPEGHSVDADEPPFFLPPAWFKEKAPPGEGQG